MKVSKNISVTGVPGRNGWTITKTAGGNGYHTDCCGRKNAEGDTLKVLWRRGRGIVISGTLGSVIDAVVIYVKRGYQVMGIDKQACKKCKMGAF